MGANQIGIDPGGTSFGGISSGAATGLDLTPEDCDAIRRECGAVRWAAPSVDGRMQLIYGNRNWNVQRVKGSTEDYLRIRNWDELAQGTVFTDDDVRSAAAVCVIGQTVADQLFGNDSPIGKHIRVKNIELKVLGVLSRKGVNMMGFDQDDFLLAPWTTVKYRLSNSKYAFATLNTSSTSSGINTLSEVYPTQDVALYPAPSSAQQADTPLPIRFNDLDDIYVSAVSAADVPLAMQQVTQVLRVRHRIKDGQPNDFMVRDSTEWAKVLDSTITQITSLLLCVALISLVVGGVGIMNIMLVSVTERTREIGLRMAVGARARDILRQFLIEAILLCISGGIVGILLGRGVSLAVRALKNWPTSPSIPAIAAAVVVSATVGIVFGYYPAWKASRLDPIEALRYE